MRFVGICQYDGSNYSGFQSQKNASSIQDHLELAISSIGGLEERINYAGRTDAGVHALEQSAHFDVKKKILFSGDAIYNGELLDTHPHSDKQVYRKTLERLQSLDAEIIHAGHEPSFGKSQMQKIITDYLSGYNAMSDPVTWFNSVTKSGVNHYSDQRW